MNFAEFVRAQRIQADRVAGVGGTSDGRGQTLAQWIAPLALGTIEWLVYMASIAPIIRPVDEHGRRASLGYSASCFWAMARARSWLGRTSGWRLLVGYSQGAEAAGNAFTRHVCRDHDMTGVTLLLLADPRGWPTALKPWMSSSRVVRNVVRRFGVELNGYRDEMKAQGGRIYSVAILGDPITAVESVLKNPFGALSGLIGFFKIHSKADHMDELAVLRDYMYGDVHRVVLYDTHPFTQVIPLCPEWFAELIAPRTVPGEEPATLFRSRKEIVRQLERARRGNARQERVAALLDAA